MFEPEEQPTSSGEPEQREGSVLQRYLSQLGMPRGIGLRPANDSPIGLRVPRYYGAPPDQHPANDVTNAEPTTGSVAENTISNVFERIRPRLRPSAAGTQPPTALAAGPYTLNPSDSNGNLPTLLGQAQPQATANSYRPDHSHYVTSSIGRLFPHSNASGAFPSNAPRKSYGSTAIDTNAVVPAPPDPIMPEKTAMDSSAVAMTDLPNSEHDGQSNRYLVDPESEQRRRQAAGASGNPANVSTENGRGAAKGTATNPAGPGTVWMIGKDGVPRRVPVSQFQSWLKNNYRLAVPLVGPYGDSRYVTLDQLKDFISYGYQPGRRVQLDAKHGLKEAIVPLEGAEQKKPEGAKLLPMTVQEANLTAKANWYGTVQKAGIPDLGLKPPRWQAGDTERAELMVSGASKANVERYLPEVIKALKWKFGENSWRDYIPVALRIITAESSDFLPRTQGGHNPNELGIGHGWVQLSNRFNFEHMNKELKLKGTKDDLIKNPGKANRPEIAAKILAQYIFDHLNDRDEIAESGERAHHLGFEPLVAKTRDPKTAPDPQAALALYVKWLRDDYVPWKQDAKRYINSLQQNKERNPRANTDALLNNDLVKERLIVNASHFQHTPFEGLPNGLERFLPAAAFERKYQDLVDSAQNPKKDMSLKEAADRWVRGVEEFGDRDYAATLRKRLGFPEGTDLSKIKLSQLPPEMLEEMILAHRDYAQQVVHSLEKLAHPKPSAARSHSQRR